MTETDDILANNNNAPLPPLPGAYLGRYSFLPLQKTACYYLDSPLLYDLW